MGHNSTFKTAAMFLWKEREDHEDEEEGEGISEIVLLLHQLLYYVLTLIFALLDNTIFI